MHFKIQNDSRCQSIELVNTYRITKRNENTYQFVPRKVKKAKEKLK